MVGVTPPVASFISELVVDADLVMGAHNITLGAGQTVDGEDVSGLCGVGDTVRITCLPTNYNTGVEGVQGNVGNVKLMDGATDEVFFELNIPEDYGTTPKLYFIAYPIGGSGNAYINVGTTRSAANESYGGNVLNKVYTAYAVVNSEVEFMDVTPGSFAVVKNTNLHVMVTRAGAHGSDTLAADLMAMCLVFEYVRG